MGETGERERECELENEKEVEIYCEREIKWERKN
jgi:hypothetical protein